MKKFLSMFAFAATIVLGAFSFVSCGDDDNIFPEQEKFQFSLTAELTSTKPEIVNNPDFQDAAQYVKKIDSVFSSDEMYGTTFQADVFWNNFLVDKRWTDLANTVIKAAKLNNDPSMTLKLKLWKEGKNGKEIFREKEYKPYYIDFL